MALIKCPECKQDVSTFASCCPNCGFPITNMNVDKLELYELTAESYIVANRKHGRIGRWLLKDIMQGELNLHISDLPQKILSGMSKENAEKIASIMKSSGYVVTISKDNASSEPSKFDKNATEHFKNIQGKVTCPDCGSTSITTGSRGYSLLTGFVGSGRTTNRCGRCGYKWNP